MLTFYIHICCCCDLSTAGSEDDLVAELRGFWSDDDWSKPNKKRDRYSSYCTYSLARQQQARCYCCVMKDALDQQLLLVLQQTAAWHPHLQVSQCTIGVQAAPSKL